LQDDAVSLCVDLSAALVHEDMEAKKLEAMQGAMNPFGTTQDNDLAVNREM
jgi:hypothetical protein